MDALTRNTDEGRDSLRKVSGSWQISFDPEMSEWGNLVGVISHYHYLNT